jgi:hypothetical protein
MHQNYTKLGSNIIKLEGYGVYVTYIDNEYFISEVMPGSGHPKLDPDKCIAWEKLKEPANQKFLNILNAHFGTAKTMHDFGCVMSISEIKEYRATQDKTEGSKKK